jgi:hypothetical protein
MGKNAKKHKKRVAKRNARLAQQKSAIQKAFDTLLQQQLNKLDDNELKVETNGKEMNFQLVDDDVINQGFKFEPNEEESSKINREFEETTEEEHSEVEN